VKKEVKKANNNNTQVKEAAKKREIVPYRVEYFDNLFSNGKIPVSQDYLKKFAQEWIEVAREDEDMLVLAEFLDKKGVGDNIMEDWMKRCPELAEAKERVRRTIAIRREKGAMKKKLDSHSVFRSQHWYDPKDKAGEEWRATLRAKNDNLSGTGNITVVMERFGNEVDTVKKSKVKKITSNGKE